MFNDIPIPIPGRAPFVIHSYGICIAIGLMACLALACFRAKKYKLDGDTCYGILFCGAGFGILGAKIAYILVDLKTYLEDPSKIFSESGFVVMGGLVCGIFAAWVYLRFFKKASFIDYFDLCAPSIALAQGFGRIGCFMAGCCYGKHTEAFFGITFTNSHFAPNGIKLIPTQLISSALDFANMAFLIILAKKVGKKKGIVSSAYIITYSVGRFLLEFLRGDVERGFIGPLSTSQFLSLISFVVGVIYLLAVIKFQKKIVAKEESVSNKETNDIADKEAEKEENVSEFVEDSVENSSDIDNYDEPEESEDL